jgi:hypothetical protein
MFADATFCVDAFGRFSAWTGFPGRLRGVWRAIPGRRGGRGAGEHGSSGAPRLSEHFLGMVDDWRRSQTDLPSRAEAIRRLLELAIKIKKKPDADH